MGSSRNTSNKIEVLKKGAEYGVAGSGFAGILLNIIGLCLAIPTPISLGIAASLGVVFCCLGGYKAVHDQDTYEQKRHQIEMVERDITLLAKDVRHHHRHHHRDASTDARLQHYSKFFTLPTQPRKASGLREVFEPVETKEVAKAPKREAMDPANRRLGG